MRPSGLTACQVTTEALFAWAMNQVVPPIPSDSLVGFLVMTTVGPTVPAGVGTGVGIGVGIGVAVGATTG